MAVDSPPMDPEVCRRLQRTSTVVGAVGLVLCALGWLVSPNDFFRSYLWAYCYFIGLALGALVLLALQFLTGGLWGLILRRIFEAATRTLPVLALLFIPIAAGFLIPARDGGHDASHSRPAISGVFIWADPAVVEADHALEFKARYYLNVPFFLTRAVICFAVWLTFAWLVNRLSLRQDRPDAGDSRALRKASAACLVAYGLTVTVMAVDWIMSLEPHWVSSIFGPLIGVGQVLNALSFAVVVLILLSDRPPLVGRVTRPILRDLGSLMLTFVMVWAYMAFSQFLLIWSGNLPPEIPYYLRRSQGGWQWYATAIAVLQFAVPYLLLLMGRIKTSRPALMRVALLIVVMRAVDLYWLIMPAQPGPDGLGVVPAWPNWTNIVAPAGVGGIWLATFLGQLQQRPLLPVFDPLLVEASNHE